MNREKLYGKLTNIGIGVFFLFLILSFLFESQILFFVGCGIFIFLVVWSVINESKDSQRKKDVGTLSNPLSGDTKQSSSMRGKGDNRLQIERSASPSVDNHADTSPREGRV